MVELRTFALGVAVALGAAFLFGGAVQAAPAHKARPAATHAKLTAAQADAAALKKFPGTVVGKTKLENEEGVWQYGVMVQSGKTLREVMVNAKTGKIDSVEVTTAKTEKKEATAEAGKAKPSPKHATAKSAVRSRGKSTPPAKTK